MQFEEVIYSGKGAISNWTYLAFQLDLASLGANYHCMFFLIIAGMGE